MNKLSVPIIAVVVLAMWQGWFHTLSRSSTDFLFTPVPGKSNQISVVGIDNESLDRIGRWPWPRQIQAKLLEKIAQGNAKVIAYDIVTSDPVANETSDLDKVYVKYPQIINPGPAAHAMVENDSDGISRSWPCAGSFALAVAQKINSTAACPTERALISYSFDQGGIEYLSAQQVLSGSAVPTKPIVLVGVTSPSLHDERQTPFSAFPMPGVIVQANLVQTLLSHASLVRIPKTTEAIILIIGISLFAYTLKKTGYVWGFGWLILSLGLAMSITISLFSKGILMDFLYLPVGLIISYITQLVYGYYDEFKKRRFVHQAFSKYISPQVMKMLLENPHLLRLGGEKREATMMISDIRSFTTVSEGMDPNELVTWLNKYLSFAAGVIHKHLGTIDKFIGDAIVAFWNAPVAQPNHAVLAANAALELSLGSQHFENVRVGVGLHNDSVLIGNIGAMDRFDYTMIGDGVNTTSRLENLTKVYQVPIIASENFVQKIKESSGENDLVFRKLDKVILKGKKLPTSLYELIGTKEQTASKAPFVTAYEKALENYFHGNWTKAKLEFSKIIKKYPTDWPSQVLLKRCQLEKPPGWAGVYTLTEK